MVTRKSALKFLGDTAVLWVDPQLITHHRGSKFPLTAQIRAKYKSKLRRPVTWASRRWHPFFVREAWLPPAEPIESEGKYRRVSDLIANRQRLERSDWYQSMIDRVRTKGSVRYKFQKMYSESEVDAFFNEHVGPLIESMAKEGYREDLAPEHGTVLVGEDGRLYKTGGGSHRFYVARELGVKSVPVTVASVHEDWVRAQGVVPDRHGLRELPKLLRSLGNCTD